MLATVEAMEAFENHGLEVRTKRTWLFVAQLIACLPFAVLMNRLIPNAAVFFPAAAISISAVVALGQTWQRWPRVRRVRVRADGDGLYLGGSLAVTRDSIRTAHVQRTPAGTIVRLVRRVRPVDILVDDDHQACALIAGLRLDPARSVVRYSMGEGTFLRGLVRIGLISALLCVLVLASMAAFFATGSSIALIAVALTFAGYFILNLRGQLTLSVGADGVEVRRWFGAARFLRYSEIAGISTDGSGVVMELRDGEALTLSHGAGARLTWFVGTETQDEAEGFAARIAPRVKAHETTDDATVRTALDRGGRKTTDWLRALRLYAETSASSRKPATPAELFWGVIEDATAPTTARVGAVVALRGTFDSAARERLRVVAAACVAPRLRIALEAASCARDDRALTAALDSLPADDDALRLLSQRR